MAMIQKYKVYTNFNKWHVIKFLLEHDYILWRQPIYLDYRCLINEDCLDSDTVTTWIVLNDCHAIKLSILLMVERTIKNALEP